jgi:hypothetical protein
MKVLLLYFYDEDAWSTMSEAERQDALRRIQGWQERPEQARRILQSGEVPAVHEIVTVRLGPAGRTEQPQVAPGPFARAAQALGGYTVAEVAHLDDAVAWAQTFPTGGVFEIRPLVEG